MALNSEKGSKSARPILEPSATVEPDGGLSEIVKESAQRLADAPQAGIQPKRGRGRHPKGCNCGKCSQSFSQPAAGHGNSSSQSNPSQPAAGFLMPSIAPILAEALKLPFAIRAVKTGFEGWRLSPEEANSLGAQLDEIVKIYMPQMDPRHAVLATFSFSLVMISSTRLMEQAAWEKQKAALAKVVKAHTAPPPQPAPAPVHSPAPGEPTSGKSLDEALAGMH